MCQVLSYFALKDEGEDCHRWIMDVLNNIEREKLLPPLLVVQVGGPVFCLILFDKNAESQILSQNDKTPLAVVKDYITRRLQEERMLIEDDQKMISELRVETEQMRTDIHRLQTKAKVCYRWDTCEGQVKTRFCGGVLCEGHVTLY